MLSFMLITVLMCFVYSFIDRMQNLPRLVEDIVQTSINTGPRGALRLAQGVQAVVGVGSEWLADVSKVIWTMEYDIHYTCLYEWLLQLSRKLRLLCLL